MCMAVLWRWWPSKMCFLDWLTLMNITSRLRETTGNFGLSIRLLFGRRNYENIDFCRTHRVLTYPWYFPSPPSPPSPPPWTGKRFLFSKPDLPYSSFRVPSTHTFSEILMTSATQIRTKIQTQRQRQLQGQWQRQRRQENNWITNSVLYFRSPDDSSIPNLMVDTSPWST